MNGKENLINAINTNEYADIQFFTQLIKKKMVHMNATLLIIE